MLAVINILITLSYKGYFCLKAKLKKIWLAPHVFFTILGHREQICGKKFIQIVIKSIIIYGGLYIKVDFWKKITYTCKK